MKPTAKRSLSPKQLAEKLGCGPRAPQRWCHEGCPHEKRGREFRFNLAEVQAWLEKQAELGRPQAGTIAAGGGAGGRPRPVAPDDVLKAIRECRSLEQHQDLVREVSALLAGGVISATVGASLKALLVELRDSIEAGQAPERATGDVYLDEEAAAVAIRYASILNGSRRARIRAMLEEEERADRVDFPDPADTKAVRARLAALGLDAHGEPV